MITVMRVPTTAVGVESMVLARMIMPMIMPVVVPMMRVHLMSVLRLVVMGMVMMHEASRRPRRRRDDEGCAAPR